MRSVNIHRSQSQSHDKKKPSTWWKRLREIHEIEKRQGEEKWKKKCIKYLWSRHALNVLSSIKLNQWYSTWWIQCLHVFKLPYFVELLWYCLLSLYLYLNSLIPLLYGVFFMFFSIYIVIVFFSSTSICFVQLPLLPFSYFIIFILRPTLRFLLLCFVYLGLYYCFSIVCISLSSRYQSPFPCLLCIWCYSFKWTFPLIDLININSSTHSNHLYH